MHMVDRALSMPSDRLLVNRLMFVWSDNLRRASFSLRLTRLPGPPLYQLHQCLWRTISIAFLLYCSKRTANRETPAATKNTYPHGSTA